MTTCSFGLKTDDAEKLGVSPRLRHEGGAGAGAVEATGPVMKEPRKWSESNNKRLEASRFRRLTRSLGVELVTAQRKPWWNPDSLFLCLTATPRLAPGSSLLAALIVTL